MFIIFGFSLVAHEVVVSELTREDETDGGIEIGMSSEQPISYSEVHILGLLFPLLSCGALL